LIKGLVQGVGFRPFIYRLAAKHGLLGEVDNRTNGVSIIVQGDLKTIDRFTNEILKNAPPASRIKAIEVIPKTIEGYDNFSITHSKAIDDQITEVSPDIAVCDECLAEMSSDQGRIDYPFINCTNCGPRFTIIEGIPYDRPKTSMKDFTMCGKCRSEYNDFRDRRFHAQPIACNECGPQYRYKDQEKDISGTQMVLNAISLMIASGRIVAIKGIGGYHLMCDALNNDSVTTLRLRKQREAKPFAVMFRDLSEVNNYCYISRFEEEELTSWRRPVLILKQKKPLADSVSNGLDTIGAMLPYMPFHHLLFKALNTPAVVMTSGNLSDEPIITDDILAEKQLMKVADSMVSYNRKIVNRTDDSVIRFTNDKISLIRRSRGFVPRPIDLDINVEGILALGAEQKNCFCIGKNSQVIMSQYIGDLKNVAACDFYKEMISLFTKLFRFTPGYLVSDMHPDYYSSVYASVLGEMHNAPVLRVQHHHAHIVSCMAEHGLDEKVIGVSLDGTGFGTDGNIWGGEFLVADAVEFERFAHFDYIPMPGGEKAAEEPWRMAFSYLFRYFGDTIDYSSIPLFRSIGDSTLYLVKDMIQKDINSPLSSGAGRLFDAVSALTGICPSNTFDAEAPMRLESAVKSGVDNHYPFTAGKSIVFAETFKAILDDMRRKDISMISAKFHNTIAQVILELSEKMREEFSIEKVVLSGGVFQNKYLLGKSISKLTKNRFKVYTNHQVPANDGGISLGQIVIASKKFGLCV
jgi:hydrogenase maturation protein HypF